MTSFTPPTSLFDDDWTAVNSPVHGLANPAQGSAKAGKWPKPNDVNDFNQNDIGFNFEGNVGLDPGRSECCPSVTSSPTRGDNPPSARSKSNAHGTLPINMQSQTQLKRYSHSQAKLYVPGLLTYELVM